MEKSAFFIIVLISKFFISPFTTSEHVNIILYTYEEIYIFCNSINFAYVPIFGISLN
ncbi:hypothetical protein RhiirA1_477241 [Rhizophagus irregularis]|uniref:Uncharacterized protein n=1 Tax=Rhizophagus irregularis TaxID=588596 RepID=A0A2I1FRG9_9GLOM|nr:hypothetical protein RhiirA1_477241 [Rhizophagus irregularis]PKY36978.1 hypothetical protein RhiirB3_460918 [Rhizophagus irregularis]